MRAPRLLPERRSSVLHAALVSALLALLLGSLVAVGAAPARADDLPDDLDTPTIPASCFGPAQTNVEPHPCKLSPYKRKRPTVVLWGDSHAWMYIPALRKAVRGKGVNLIGFVAGSCPPVYARTRPPGGYSGKCERSNAEALRYVKRLQKKKWKVRVVLGSNWSGFRIAYRRMMLGQVGFPDGYDNYTRQMVRLAHEGTPALFTRLGKLGIRTDVIGQAATVPDRTAPCADGTSPYRCDIVRWRAIPEETRTARWLAQQMQQLPAGKRYVDATGAYCDRLVCHGLVSGVETWYDKLHLSATRTGLLARYFTGTVRAAKRR